MRNLRNTLIVLFILSIGACSKSPAVWVPGWQETSTLSVARAGSAVVAHNGFIYMIAGVDGRNFLKTMEYAKIKEDGSLEAWKQGPLLNIERGFVDAVVTDGNIYIVGGGNGPYGQNLLASAEHAVINPDGSLGEWQLEKFSMDTPRRCSKLIVSGNHIYSFGGYGGAMLDTVERTEILKDGTLSEWVYEDKTMTMLRYINGVKKVNGIVYVVGGHDESRGVGITNVEQSNITKTGATGATGASGGLQEWKATTQLQTGRYALATAAYGNYLYALGGITGVKYLSTIEKAKIDSNGNLSAWQPTTELSLQRANFSTVVYKDKLYILGGVNNDRYLTNVEYASFSDKGDIGYMGTEADQMDYKKKLAERAKASLAPLPNQGLVKEVLQTSAYTYVLVSSAKGNAWLAGPKIDVQVNDTISFPEGVNMPNFRSSELNRNFRQVIFVGEIRKEVGGGQSQQQAPPQAQQQATAQSGGNVVKEVLQTSIYTYLLVTQGSGTVWLAAPKLDIQVGEQVSFPPGATMKDFTSKELRRTFATVIFVGQVQKLGLGSSSQSRPQSKPKPSGNEVKEVLQTSIYTYLLVTQGSDTVWVAAPKVDIHVGDSVSFPAGTTMTNFHSKELDRDFPTVVFVGRIQKVQ